MGAVQFRDGHADAAGREFRLVDPPRVVQHGGQPLFLHVAADPHDDLLRRKGLAEGVQRPPPQASHPLESVVPFE